jgi:predicted nucleotidyltransferase
MFATKEEIILVAKEVLSAYGGKVSYAYLFGSGLTKLRSDSDIDILVGGNLDFDSRMDLTAKLVLALRRSVDVVPAEDARPEVVLKALSKGMPILINDAEALKSDYFKNFRLYDDTTNLRRLKLERIKRQYARG